MKTIRISFRNQSKTSKVKLNDLELSTAIQYMHTQCVGRVYYRFKNSTYLNDYNFFPNETIRNALSQKLNPMILHRPPEHFEPMKNGF